MGGREGKQQQGDKREVVIGRRGKAWVPWEQLWQVGIINLETAIKRSKIMILFNTDKKEAVNLMNKKLCGVELKVEAIFTPLS